MERVIPGILKTIAADFSVQAHFGRMWTRNFWLNLRLAARGCDSPKVDRSKIALIAAAGPGLESRIDELRAQRRRYCVVSTDTAYGALIDNGIIPDFFVSIDGQAISSMHAQGGFRAGTSVVMELCGNHDLALLASRSGAPLYFFAGNHPLSALAARTLGIPTAETSSGTVTLAAGSFAHSAGFSRVEYAGADFAYLGGKPYARGTYLSALYGAAGGRRKPAESLFAALLFRSETRRVPGKHGGIDYRTDLLDSYAAAFHALKPGISAGIGPLRPFDFSEFAERYLREVAFCANAIDVGNPTFLSLMPFIAWYRRKRFDSPNGVNDSDADPVAAAIQLALRLIEGYTSTT